MRARGNLSGMKVHDVHVILRSDPPFRIPLWGTVTVRLCRVGRARGFVFVPPSLIGCLTAPQSSAKCVPANLPTHVMDFTGFDSKHNLNCKGWNSQAHRGFPGCFESSNLSRDNGSIGTLGVTVV